jgi:hypothetical protein
MPFGLMSFLNFPFVRTYIASETVLNGFCRLVMLCKPPVFDECTNRVIRP